MEKAGKVINFEQDELLVIKEAVWRQLPGKATHLQNVAKELRDEKAEENGEQREALFEEFILIHEEIDHLIRIYKRALRLLGEDHG